MDEIRLEMKRFEIRVASVVEKMREGRLTWFIHMQRRCVNASVRRCEGLVMVDLRIRRGRPKKSWDR